MELLETGPELAPYALRALTTVARAGESGLDRPQRAILDALQRLVLGTDCDLDALPAIAAAELASHVADPAQARQLVRLMVATSLADGPPSPEQVALLESFAEALGVREPSVEVIRHLARKRVLRFRLAFMRHAHVRNYFRNSYRILGGVLPVIRALLVFRGVLTDPEMAARFRALEALPKDSLGHQFFRHCTEAGLPFPGEKGGFPIGAVYHDFAHVLGGYDTTPEGEMKAAAFQAGFTQDDDDFFTALFAIVIHTAGINLAPFPMPVLRGRIGQEGLAMAVFRALRRGAAMKVDLGGDWDFWNYVERPIEEVRQELGVPRLDAGLEAVR